MDKDPEFDEEFESEMKKVLKKENFNNRLMKEMIENNTINKKFLHFLIDDAREEVRYSRINDKESHYEAIELYIQFVQKFFEDEGNQPCLKNGIEGKSTDKGWKEKEENEIY